MRQFTDHEITEAMLKYGGSFVQCLAYAMQAADASNFAKLKAAFPEYWAEFTELARFQVLK